MKIFETTGLLEFRIAEDVYCKNKIKITGFKELNIFTGKTSSGLIEIFGHICCEKIENINCIEDGIHYTEMSKYISEKIYKCCEYGKQLFAITQSLEFIHSIPLCLAGYISLYRIEKDNDNDEITVISYSEDELMNSIELGLEVR